MRGALAALAFVALGACVSSTEVTRVDTICPEGSESRAVAQVFFGRNIGGALGVSEADWTRFVDSEITPRFPEGLTVYEAQGQWRDSETGAVVREPSKVLVVMFADEAQGRARIAEIAAAYKGRFQQQAVAIVIERSCVSF